MALYKAKGTQPAVGTRINGAVWSPVGPGSTIRGWVYPTLHPSSQFGRFNDLLRSADETWAEMDPTIKDAWARQVMPWPPPGWWLWCWIWPIYPYPAWSPHDFFIHLQAWAAVQGIPGPVLPPVPTAVPADDAFSLVCGASMWLTWSRSSPGPAGGSYVAVFARAGLTFQSVAGPHQKQVFCGCLPIQVGIPVDVEPICRAKGLAGPGLRTRLLVCVGENGIYPLAAAWLLSSPPMPALGWGLEPWGAFAWGDGAAQGWGFAPWGAQPWGS